MPVIRHTLKLKRKWFNPLYFIIEKIIQDNSIRTVLIYGGKSSSKTVSICQNLTREAVANCASSISYRKESAIIPTTIKKSFNLAIDSMYLNAAIERQDRRYLSTTTWGNAEIILKGLDDSEKAKGIESYKYVYLDELNHFEHSEYEQFNLSLRGILGQKIFGSWNPVDENSWVKTELVDKHEWIDCDEYGTLPSENSFIKKSSDGKAILIRTVYQDNYWITGSPCGTYGYRDENLISEYETLATRNANSYKVNVLGEWGKTVFGGEFLKCWKSEIHTGHYPYNPKLAVHLIFDENVNPYFPCGIFQIDEDHKARIQTAYLIHAIALKNPDNTTKVMGREITRKLHEWQHKEAVFIGGDPSSQKDDVKQEKGHDLFLLIANELKEFKPRRFLLTAAPSVRMSADFFNSILEIETQGIRFRVDRKCRVAILDYENTKEDKNGKVDKKPVTDPVTKVSYQPWGHWCFVGDTLVETIEGPKRIDLITPRDFVLTRNGYKKVLALHRNGTKNVVTYSIGETLIKCTPDHHVYTYENDFVAFDSIKNKLSTFIVYNREKKRLCKTKLYCTMGSDLQDTPNRKTDQSEFTFLDGLKLMVRKQKRGFIITNILLRCARFLKDIMFTMQTRTHSTTTYPTLNCCTAQNTELNTPGLQNTAIQIVKQQHFEEEEVFDLSVEGQHEYFANGILVHNCDLTRYFLVRTFAQEYAKYQAGDGSGKISSGKSAPSKNNY